MEVSITGAKIYYVIPGINYPITQTVVNAWIAMVVIVGLCIWLTRGMQVHARTKRQVVAEMIVQMAQKLVRGNMGAKWDSFVPFIAAILSMSVVSSLMGLTGAYSPTNDLNTFHGVFWCLSSSRTTRSRQTVSEGISRALRNQFLS